ncbi:SIR2 family protein [Pseudoalteromonas sp. NZS127_1]|uniref:SIR2 family protein n=1 Tax=Pseudoalteromonas sp. NZS127_1 TaxID=2792074 RepID=UPI0018CF5AA1|nr:SIR2 family protein [Pseudoalteromonas sp. NZS127_1]MBG9993435.1 SIR2 family protein [Pseudoalteromonas sp. NZS127_1]
MHDYHDPVRHLKYLRQSLSQDNEAIGFFISAGCPLSVNMPDGQWPLIPDVKSLTIHINEQFKANTQYQLLLKVLQEAGKNVENIEDILSFLRSLLLVSKGGAVRGLTESELLDLENKICSVIVAKLDVTLPDQETPYHRLCKWMGSIDRKVAVEIFTTNYDLLIEQALEDSEVPYFDGFVGSRRSFFDLRAVEDSLIPIHWSRLWKIHGSINWYQETEKDKEGKDVKKVYRSSEIKEGASHLIYPSHLKYEESRKMPYLALIDQLNRFIRKKSSLLILSGYSFNDGHLNDTIVNALKANPTGMVLGLMFDTYESKNVEGELVDRYPEAYRLANKRHNLNIWTYDKAIIGTNTGSWSAPKHDDYDYDIKKFIHRSDADDDGKFDTLIKLGDFSVFTNFLKKIIGSSKEGKDA